MSGRWLVLGHALAYWPVWIWYATRMTSGSDEPWGVVALLAVVGLMVMRGRQSQPAASAVVRPAARTRFGGFGPAIALALVYTATLPWTPLLVRALIAASSILMSFPILSRLGLGGAGLVVWSLPLGPALQFYLGYPLRVVATAVAASLLRGAGQSASRAGVELVAGPLRVAVDAPCSGVKMLWTAGFLAAIIAVVLRLSATRSIGLGLITLALVVAGNGLRAASLFFIETGLIAAPPWAHDAVGLVTFSMAAGLIVATGTVLGRGPCARQPVA